MFSPAVRSAAVLGRAPDGARLHFVWPYPFPYRNREAVVAYRWRKEKDGVFTLEWKSDAAPGDPKEGVRISRVAGETRVEALGGNRSRVIYTYLGDLGGKFPEWA